MELNARLWTKGAETDLYNGDLAAYQAAVLEQYKTYVEMADRISERRGITNTFFLTLNTAIFSAAGFYWDHKSHVEVYYIAFPLIMLLGECFAWFYILRSYRLLNTAKYEVVGALETRLPASPYWRAEWVALGEGKDPRKYWPLSHIESWIPIFFAALYLGGFVVLMVTQPS